MSLPLAATAWLLLVTSARAQEPTLLERIEALALDSLAVGSVEVRFSPGENSRAEELADLVAAAGSFFEDELVLRVDVHAAVLSPTHWFSPYGSGMPYGIPWASVTERWIVLPASLTEGALIDGRDRLADRRRVDFVALHELGHLAAKQYLHPQSNHEELPILWFEELVATYFAYAFVFASDPDWATAAREDWTRRLIDFTPRTFSLDWGFMRDLPPEELSRTYGWYQYALNLRVAEVHEEHGLGFLATLRDRLPLDAQDEWTTPSLLARLEEISPGFQEWANRLQEGGSQKP